MLQIVTFRLLVRDPPAKSSVCDKTGWAVKLTGCWNDNPLTHRGSTFLEIEGFENGFTSSSR